MTRETAELIIKHNLHRLNDGMVTFICNAILVEVNKEVKKRSK